MIDAASVPFVRLAEAAVAVLLALEVWILVRFLSWSEATPTLSRARRMLIVGAPLLIATGFAAVASVVARSGALAPGLPGAGMPWEQVTDETPALESARAGERAYLNRCAPCHLPGGEGLPPSYPSLAESPIVRGPVSEHVRAALLGSAGFAVPRPGAARMPAFGPVASDAELAAILTYQRSRWGAGAAPVRPSDVARGREEGGGRAAPLPDGGARR